MDSFNIARWCFIHLNWVCTLNKLGGITGYKKAKVPIHKYIKAAKTITDLIFQYIGSFDDKTVEKSDLLFLFIHPKDIAFSVDAIEPVEEALVSTCRQVNSHYTYTAKEVADNVADDDIESGDNHEWSGGTVVEEVGCDC